MKNMEINKKLGFKVVAVLTSASMVLGGLAGCGKNTTQETTAIEQTSEADESDDLLTNVMNQVVHHSSTTGTELQKDEVVYVMADAQGNTQKIIVSDCLKNANGDSTIKDASSLSDIVNVKGDESYTVDADGNLVWNANGSDIYYQGTTDKELPVDVSISYELEGEEISPEDLVGKTGNVTIRFTYTNNEKTTVEVNGKEKEVYVPFAMISGALLPAEHFSDIEVTNGKVISEGDNNVVVGIAFPGLKDSINIDSLKDKAIDDEAKEKLDEVEIPETVEIHAYATDFEMNQTMTMAMSNLLSDLNLDDTLDIDTSKITDSMNELKDATQQLKDGSTELNDGMATLQEGAQTLADKSRDLDSGAGELVNGIGTLNEGAASLNSGADELNSGAGSLKDGAASLNEGAATLNNGAGSLKDGISQVNSGAESLNSGAASLDSGIKTLQAGTGQLASGASTLNVGAKQLQAGIQSASDAVDAIKGGFETSEENKTDANKWGLIYASEQAVSVADSLYKGITQLLTSMTAVTEQNAQIQTALFSMEDQLEGARAAVGDMGDAPSVTYSTGSGSSTESSSTNQNSGSSSENSSNTEASNAGSDETQTQEAAVSVSDASAEQETATAEAESTNVGATDYSDVAVNDTEVQPQSEEIEISVASESNESDENSVAVSDVSDTSDSESTDNSNEGNSDTNQNDSSQENASENTDDPSGQEESGQQSSDSSDSSNEESSSVVNVDEIAAYYYELGYKNGQKDAYDEFEEMLSELAAVMDNNTMLCDGTDGQTTEETLIGSLKQLQQGASSLLMLTKGVNEGINKVYGALTQLKIGTEDQKGQGGFVALNAGAAQLAAGTNDAVNGAKQLDDGAKQLASGSSTLLAGTNTLKSGTSQLLTGAQTLKDGTQTLQNGTQTLLNGTQSLKDGTQTLKDGTQTLQDGTLELLKGGQTLKDGTSQFVDGTAELNDGALQLLDGTGELMDGLFKFDEEGISKLTDLFGDNVQDVIDELQAVFDAGRSYKIYSDSASDMDSSVKFIYKTEAVK